MISSVQELEDNLSEPTPAVVETMRRLEGDILVLGVGGKMGPTLARMAKRASDAAGVKRRVIGVSRFSSSAMPDTLRSFGVEPVAADLLNRDALASLPEAPNVVFMAGMKFGSTGQEALTWAMNCYLPGMVCERFRRSRIVAFSTGNVYGLTSVSGRGSKETDLPNPLGDYAMSCLGRERIFEHFSRTLNVPVALIRLNYAVELRYGVLVDVAKKVWAGKIVDVSMGYANVIWQQEANAMSLRAFDHVSSPPKILNVSGPQKIRIRDVAQKFGSLLGREAKIQGTESPDALLNDGSATYPLVGEPRVSVEKMMEWIAGWIKQGGESLGKPTHFEARDGRF
jgi:nucleoside-diphosphate-sugar epimerase